MHVGLAPVAYYSKALDGMQGRKHATWREAYAVQEAVKRFYPYLDGCANLRIETDASTVVSLFAHKVENDADPLTHFRLALNEHGVKKHMSVHQPGVSQETADWLSRAKERLRQRKPTPNAPTQNTVLTVGALSLDADNDSESDEYENEDDGSLYKERPEADAEDASRRLETARGELGGALDNLPRAGEHLDDANKDRLVKRWKTLCCQRDEEGTDTPDLKEVDGMALRADVLPWLLLAAPPLPKSKPGTADRRVLFDDSTNKAHNMITTGMQLPTPDDRSRFLRDAKIATSVDLASFSTTLRLDPTSGEGWYCLFLGLGAAVGTYRLLSHMLEQSSHELESFQDARRRRTKRNAWYGDWRAHNKTVAEVMAESTKSLDIDALAHLALSSNHRLRTAATELLFDSVMTPRMLSLLIAMAGEKEGNTKSRLRAVTVLQILAQTPARQPKLVAAGALGVLVQGMRCKTDKELVMRSASTLLDLLSQQENRLAERYRRKAASSGLLVVVSEILQANAEIDEQEEDEPESQRSKVHYADTAMIATCAMITKLYALRTAFHRTMIDLGFLPALLGVAKKSVAELDLVRTVMESIVRLCTYLSAYRASDASSEPSPHMAELLDLGAVDVVAVCIRQDDQGVSSWGIGLLHEFVSRGVGKELLAASPGIVRWLCRNLSTSKYAYTNQLILRSLWCLCTTSKQALADASAPPNLRRILSIFAAEDDVESHYWSVALVSRISLHRASHKWILDSPLPKALNGLITGLARNLQLTLLPEIASIISRLCHALTTAPLLVSYPEIAEACHLLMKTDVDGARLVTIMAIINATATSRAFLDKLIDDNMRRTLIDMLGDFSNEQAQNHAAKGLVALMYCDKITARELTFDALMPHLVRFNEVYRSIANAYFRRSDDRQTVDWGAKTFSYHLSTVSAILSALQVYLGEQQRGNCHYLACKSTDDVFAQLIEFQQNLLAHIAILMMHLLDLGKSDAGGDGDPDDDSPEVQGKWSDLEIELLLALNGVIRTKRGKAECARSGINTFVTAYYIHSQNDPHFAAATEDNLLLLRDDRIKPATRSQGGSLANVPWQDEKIRRRSQLARAACKVSRQRMADKQPNTSVDIMADAGSSEENEEKYPGDLMQPRVRCLLPILRVLLSTLADTLEPSLMLQSPETTRRALWIMRIFYHELPTLRGAVMRVLSVINIKMLIPADAAGLVNLCTRYLVDCVGNSTDSTSMPRPSPEREDAWRSVEETARIVSALRDPYAKVATRLPTATLSDDPGISSAKAEEECCLDGGEWHEWQKKLSHLGVATEVDMSARSFFERYPELRPETLTQFGRFYAQFAIDRFTAKWDTCAKLYTCVVPPCTAIQGSCLWIVDRSGPRGTGLRGNAAVPMPGAATGAAPVSGVLGDVSEQSGSEDLQQSSSHSGAGRFTADALPLVSSPLSSTRHHQRPPHSSGSSTTSTSSTSGRLANRPPSPFPSSIVTGPASDLSLPSPVATAAPPPPPPILSLPDVSYRNHAPYYPVFVALADGCSVWNSSWKFESIRTRTGLDGRLGGVHRFHVRLLTAGLIQVGWCSDQCGFYPESGEGVGDDFESVSYDGYRSCKWYGLAEDSMYGEEWHAGDIITAELDLDMDRVVFYRNGRSMGLAFGMNEQGAMEGAECGFQGLSRDRTWYPAFSLASEQGLVFLGSDDVRQTDTTIAERHNGEDRKLVAEYGEIILQSSDCSTSGSQEQAASPPPPPTPSAVIRTARDLSTIGVLKAFKLRFDFQDLDAFPCVSLSLPGSKGQITVGPITDLQDLSSYLQPHWWAVWTTPDDVAANMTPNIVDTPTPELSRWFVSMAKKAPEAAASQHRAVMLTRNLEPGSWIYFIVLDDGQICVSTHWPKADATSSSTASPVVFDMQLTRHEIAGGCHIWLPTVSPAVVSFDLEPIYV
ncbi:hypothetical protein GQ54DRAFT_325603 [Martensiomyces pterosporus]|nr:hypothetical protein GQ54DRAFT_325603 [Martensiomyces pterosporus]